MIEARYIDLSEEIEKGIKKGRWQGRMPGVIKLSRELDANPATVSKAFKLLSEKGLLTIDGTKGTYITQVQHQVIGIVGIKTEHVNSSEAFSVMEKTAEAQGYRLVGIAHKNDLFVKDLNLLLKFPVDGYIFMNSTLTFEIAMFLRENGVPFVSCNNPVEIPGVNWVDFASECDFEKAMRYLIELGHEKIAYVEFYNRNYNYTERMRETCKKVLSEAGLSFDNSLFMSGDMAHYYNMHGEEYQRAYGVDSAKEIMKQKEKPTAVLITGLSMAHGFADELKKYNLKVPEDMSIISYNFRNIKDDFFTTLFNDYGKKFSTAVKMLLELFEAPRFDARAELMEGKIIVKKSSSKREVKNI